MEVFFDLSPDAAKTFSARNAASSSKVGSFKALLVLYNIDVEEYLMKKVPVTLRDFSSVPKMIVIKSGEDVASMKGVIAGGSIMNGVLRVGDTIEVSTGIPRKEKCTPAP